MQGFIDSRESVGIPEGLRLFQSKMEISIVIFYLAFPLLPLSFSDPSDYIPYTIFLCLMSRDSSESSQSRNKIT